MDMFKFEGAASRETEQGREYSPRGPIWLRAEKIVGFYDHTVLVEGHKIRVMETAEEIQKKLRTWRVDK